MLLHTTIIFYLYVQDIADEQFAEATVGYTNLESAKLYQQLFDTPYFK